MDHQCITEEWRPAAGFEGFYEVSSFGRIRSLKYPTHYGPVTRKKPRILSLSACRGTNGYVKTTLCINGKRLPIRVHRLIAASYLGPPPDGKRVNHISFDRTDNRIWNLEYLTAVEDYDHARRNGRRRIRQPKVYKWQVRGSAAPAAKFTEDDVAFIRGIAATGVGQHRLSRMVGVSQATICHIVHRKTWRHVKTLSETLGELQR